MYEMPSQTLTTHLQSMANPVSAVIHSTVGALALLVLVLVSVLIIAEPGMHGCGTTV